MRRLQAVFALMAILAGAALLTGCRELRAEAQPPVVVDAGAPATAAATAPTAVPAAEVATEAVLVLAATATAPAPAATASPNPTTPPATTTPEARATATPDGPSAVVLAKHLNVRGGPGSAYPVLHVIEQGEVVRTLALSADRAWVQVESTRGRGWAAARYLRVEQADMLPVAAELPPPPSSPAVIATPTQPPAPTPPPPPIPACDTLPVRGFGVVWAEHPEIQPLLGCPSFQGTERGTEAAVQPFEHGQMIWVGDDGGYQPADPTFVLFDDGDWAFFPEMGTATVEETPPPGLFAPEDVFARVWRDGTGAQVRERLGWATAPLSRGGGAVQGFWNGRMIWVGSTDTIYVLVEQWSEQGRRRQWFQFEDTFEG